MRPTPAKNRQAVEAVKLYIVYVPANYVGQEKARTWKTFHLVGQEEKEKTLCRARISKWRKMENVSWGEKDK